MHPASSIQSGVVGSGQQPRVSGDKREQFAADELAIVLSHYDIGTIDSISEFSRGSRKAPKLLISTEHGKFLLKRRARGKDEPHKVAFTHAIQLALASRQFPLPHLIGTKGDNNSMLTFRSSVYELFEYISGQTYPHTLEATFDAGRVQGLFHKLLTDFKSDFQPGTGSYHRTAGVEQALRAIPASRTAGAQSEESGKILSFLLASYEHAGKTADELGIDKWPRHICHADWHPGNMLFRDNLVVAVIDYDSARFLPRVVDVANGALQFSIIGGDEDVSKWPDFLDESRLKRFIRGYDEVILLSQAEVKALPWLMIEAMIAESVFPIAATGSFGRMEGMPFLLMVQRKVHWIQKNHQRIVEIAEG